MSDPIKIKLDPYTTRCEFATEPYTHANIVSDDKVVYTFVGQYVENYHADCLAKIGQAKILGGSLLFDTDVWIGKPTLDVVPPNTSD